MSEAEWTAFLQRPEIPAFNRAMRERPDDGRRRRTDEGGANR